ncbi:conserved hypothetical protein [Trichinella spiralis]|uniref:hypothetical protein n=1 Tax=Trichinella spiralis TaxID=6334 RepID=UPI0001EFEC26|nr:conserved hypothetical protein [Trichinella spiralis]
MLINHQCLQCGIIACRLAVVDRAPTVELIEKLLLVEVCLSRRRTKARNSFLTFGRDCSAQSHHLSSPLVDHGQAKSFDTIKLLSTALLLLQTTTVSTVDEFIHQVGGGSNAGIFFQNNSSLYENSLRRLLLLLLQIAAGCVQNIVKLISTIIFIFYFYFNTLVYIVVVREFPFGRSSGVR